MFFFAKSLRPLRPLRLGFYRDVRKGDAKNNEHRKRPICPRLQYHYPAARFGLQRAV